MQGIRLGARLLAIAKMIGKGASIIDVGTDHAYLPAYLIVSGTVDAAKASDIRIGPLQKAGQTARKHGLNSRLTLRCCPGLSGFSPEDGDTIVIAGMGGETIAEILEGAQWLRDGHHRLILQPMTSNEDLRDYLFRRGYTIRDEVLTKDGRKLYTILDVTGGAGERPRSSFERYVSRHVLKEALAEEYLNELLLRLEKQRDGLCRAKAPAQKDVDLINEEINGIAALREEWRECRQ